MNVNRIPFFCSENYRRSAYKQYTYWVQGHLGKTGRIPLPSCAINKIRTTYPSDSYTLFKWWDDEGTTTENEWGTTAENESSSDNNSTDDSSYELDSEASASDSSNIELFDYHQ